MSILVQFERQLPMSLTETDAQLADRIAITITMIDDCTTVHEHLSKRYVKTTVCLF